MLRLSAFSGSPACDEVADQIGAADAATIEPVEDRRMFEPLARSRFDDWRSAASISDLPRSMPRSRAVLPRPAGGVTSHITAVTTRSRRRPTARLCQRKIVWRNGMIPPGPGRRARRSRGSAAAARPASPSAAQRIRSSPAPRRCRARESWRRRARDSRRPRRGARFPSRARR